MGSQPDATADAREGVAGVFVDGAETDEAVITGNGARDTATQSDEELIEAALRGDVEIQDPDTDTGDRDPEADSEADLAVADGAVADGAVALGEGPEPRRRDQKQAVRSESRRVRRVVRKIDPWSVLKVSVIFYICLYVIVIVASVLLWSAAISSGTVDNVEGFVKDLGFTDVDLLGGQMFRALLFGGAIMIVVATGFTVLIAVLFNLISDLVGGIRVTMIEQEIERPSASAERSSLPPEAADSVSGRPGL